jgi:hypothetical protein
VEVLRAAQQGLFPRRSRSGPAAEKADAQAQAARKPLTENDRQVRAHAQRTIEEGMRSG